MPNKKRFLKSLDINFISLVDKAANQKTVIFKSADSDNNSYQKTVDIVKVNNDQQEVIGIVYEPDVADTDGDYTSAEEIKKAEYQFMRNRNTNNVDQQHDEVADEGFVAESWIVQKNDARLPDATEGSWAVVIKVENKDTWDKVKSGEITGLSMGGMAIAEAIEKSEKQDQNFFEKITKLVKDGITSIKKDFNSQWNQDNLRRMAWALTDSISEILNDDEVGDKKAEIIKNVEQFKTAVESYNFDATASSTVSKNKQKDKYDMNEEEIKQIVKSAVAESIDDAIGTIRENIEKMKGEVNEKAGAIEERLTKVENSTPGSAQESATEVFKSDDSYKGPGWLS